MAPCGKMDKQLDVLVEKAEDSVRLLSQGGANRSVTAVHFTNCLWQLIAYPLTAMNMTPKQSERLERALYIGTLSHLGLLKSFLTVMRYLPCQYYGAGLPCPRAEMNFSKINYFLRHSLFQTVPGHML